MKTLIQNIFQISIARTKIETKMIHIRSNSIENIELTTQKVKQVDFDFYNIKSRNFAMKNMKPQWSEQQDKSLKFLKEDQKIKDWDQIAKMMNQNYKHQERDALSCRNRYFRYAKFGQGNRQTEWSAEEDKMLMNFISELGFKWNEFSYYFPNKPENSIKNRFYSSVRKAVKFIKDRENLRVSQRHNDVTRAFFTRLLDLSLELQKSNREIFEKINQAFDISGMKEGVLNLLFQPNSMEDKEVLELIKKIKKFNIKIRSYGIFKTKSIKNWKLSEKSLSKLLQTSMKTLGVVKYEEE